MRFLSVLLVCLFSTTASAQGLWPNVTYDPAIPTLKSVVGHDQGDALSTPVQIGHGDGNVTQVRRYRKPGSTEWAEFTSSESVATPAAALIDGQTIAGP